MAGKAAGWVSMSDVALHRKLGQSERWLHGLCAGLLAEHQASVPASGGGLRMRLVDGTLVQEPGASGSQWRVLYSLGVPGWQYDDFRLTPARDAGHGESLAHLFKRLKSLANLGHVPKHDPCSARAWVDGKLLLALLAEKMARQAARLSPQQRGGLDPDPAPQSVA